MKKFLLSAAFLISISAGAFAQMIDYHWDNHGVGFSIPRDFGVSTNNAEEFSADNGNLFLTILPFQDKNVTKDNLADAVVAIATEMDYDSIEEADAADVDDFTGYYVKGTKEGVNALVMALLDSESSTNLIVIIAYVDGMEAKAIDIANSFYAYDK